MAKITNKEELMAAMEGKTIEQLEALKDGLKPNLKGMITKRIKEIKAAEEVETVTQTELLSDMIETLTEEKTDHLNELEAAIIETADLETDTTPETVQTADDEEEILIGGFNKLQTITDTLKNMDKGQKVELTAAANEYVEEAFKEIGLYAMIGRKGNEVEEKLYYSKLDLTKLYKAQGVESYSEGHKDIKKAFKNKTALRHFRENTKGEVMLISTNAEQNGGKWKCVGKTALFIKPNEGETLKLYGKEGIITLTSDNWDKEPLALFSDGGRATKYAHFVAMAYILDTDYERKETEKYQGMAKREFLGKHWMILTTDGTDLYGMTRNNNARPLQNTNIENGWANVIKELQTISK